MKAVIVKLHKPGTARMQDIPEPHARDGSILVEATAVGVCGTDVEIVQGKYGWAPLGNTGLLLGHESLGRVADPGLSGTLKKGVSGRTTTGVGTTRLRARPTTRWGRAAEQASE